MIRRGIAIELAEGGIAALARIHISNIQAAHVQSVDHHVASAASSRICDLNAIAAQPPHRRK
jgi:hypothetical protein